MKVPIQKRLVTPLLALSILTVTPNTVFSAEEATQETIVIPQKWLLASLVLVIPLWQLYRKSSKAQIPPEDEYSGQEIMASTGILWRHFISNPTKKLFYKRNNEYSKEEVKDAAKVLWKNLKNLYHMGFVGQLRLEKILTLYKGKYIQCLPKTPARGILGNLVDMLGVGEKVITKFLYIVGAYFFFRHISIHGYTIKPNYDGTLKPPETKITP